METAAFNALVTRKALKELWLDVSHKCNLACKHCLFGCSPENEGPGMLTLEECTRFTQEALTEGLKAVYITGGEPFLWPYLFEYLEWYFALDTVLPLTILTNGTLITEEFAVKLKKYAPQGLSIRVSMECYTRGNHEEYRGQGSFERTISGIRNLNAQGIRPWVAYVNKSGGDLETTQASSLETDFNQRLKEDFGLEINGLKIIAAYGKGRFSGEVNVTVCPNQIRERIETVQCAYGIAVSKLGVVPCPILTDVPEAVIAESCANLVGQTFSLNYDFCASCFATGTTCGQ
jgi:sulfatase maturation enzyme AslB (radical SAM superfamily)